MLLLLVLSDIQPMDPAMSAAIGQWFQVFFYLAGGIAAVLGAVLGWQRLKARGPVGDEPITRSEVQRLLTSIDTKLAILATKQEVQHVETTARAEIARVENSVNKLEDYTRKRVHDLTNKLQPMSFRLIRIEMILELLAKKVGVVVPAAVDEKLTSEEET